MKFWPACLDVILASLTTAGCTHGYSLATLNVTPVVSGPGAQDVVLAITKSDDNGEDTRSAAHRGTATFQVAAGRVYLAATGTAFEQNVDTGGAVYGCSGETDLRVRWGRIYDVELKVDCEHLYTLD